MSKIFNFIRSLFTTTNNNVENNNTASSVNTTIDSNNTTSADSNEYTDVFGNILKPGAEVINILYNDSARRGYYTILNDYKPVPVETATGPYIGYQYLLTILTSDKVTFGRKSGYLHVMAA